MHYLECLAVSPPKSGHTLICAGETATSGETVLEVCTESQQQICK